MLRRILCLSSSNPGAGLAGLAAASQQAALHSCEGSLKRLFNAKSSHTDCLVGATAGPDYSASSALHHSQQDDHCQQHIAANTNRESQKHLQHRQDPNSSSQQQSSWTTGAAAAALPASHPHLQLLQQQGWWSQQQWQSCRHLSHNHHHHQQQQTLQGPAAFWLVGQAWRGIQHPNKPVPTGKRPPAAPKPKPEARKPQMRRNTQITAPVVMVIMPDGTKQEMVLSAALDAAAGLGLDLVEVNAKGQPPVTRVMDWGKFAYEQQQKADAADKLQRQQQKLSTPKEMQFSARIADHDLEVKMRKVAGWLDLGHRVQLVVKHGREEEAAAAEALDYLLARVQADYNVEAGAQQQQRRAVSLLVKPLGGPGEAAKNKAAEGC